MFYILDTWTHRICRETSDKNSQPMSYASEYEADEAARRINNAYGFDSEADKRYKITTEPGAWK